MAGGVVVVFDFDKTLLDCDSDNWLVDELGVSMHYSLNSSLPCLGTLSWMMMELHSRGKTIEDISKCLEEAPLIHPRIVSAIKSAHSAGCDLRILSDANVFYIETILKHHGLLDCFSQINTNPSFVDGQGLLRILPYHDFKFSSHNCNICPPNMCNGMVMERIFKTCEGKKRFIYVGDGSADFCAGLKLVEGDILMPRNNFPVRDLISSNPLSIKADIHAWSDGEELGNGLLNLIDTTLIEESCSTSEGHHLLPPAAADSKFQTSTLLSHGSFSNAVPIPH